MATDENVNEKETTAAASAGDAGAKKPQKS